MVDTTRGVWYCTHLIYQLPIQYLLVVHGIHREVLLAIRVLTLPAPVLQLQLPVHLEISVTFRSIIPFLLPV